jgi:hypothetical protein
MSRWPSLHPNIGNAMNIVSPRPESTVHALFGRWQRLFRCEDVSAAASQSYRMEAAHAALAQAMSPAERMHAVKQAQSAGLPLHEIERELDWSDARAAADIK